MALSGGAPLLARRILKRWRDHADIAVTPGLARDPFDQIVVIGVLVAVHTLGFRRAARLCNDMHISVGNKVPGVARLIGPNESGACAGCGGSTSAISGP